MTKMTKNETKNVILMYILANNYLFLSNYNNILYNKIF